MDSSNPGESQNPYRPPNELADSSGLDPSKRTTQLLQETRPWVRFLGIIGFVMVGFMIVGAIALLVSSLAGMGVQGIIMSAVYGLLAFVYVYPSMFLLRYASRITEFVSAGTVESLDNALAAQKSFWKFAGVFMAVVLCAYAVMGVVLMLGVVAGSL